MKSNRQRERAQDTYQRLSQRMGISICDTMALLHLVRKHNISNRAANELFQISSRRKGTPIARSLYIAEKVESQLIPQLVQNLRLTSITIVY